MGKILIVALTIALAAIATGFYMPTPFPTMVGGTGATTFSMPQGPPIIKAGNGVAITSTNWPRSYLVQIEHPAQSPTLPVSPRQRPLPLSAKQLPLP